MDGTLADPRILQRLREVLDGQPWGTRTYSRIASQRGGARQLSLDGRNMANEAGPPTLILLSIDQIL
jgi:hypothetical protein